MRFPVITGFLATLVASACLAQTTLPTTAPGPSTQELTTEPTTEPSTEPSTTNPDHPWSFSISALTYFIPNDHEYVQPTFTADRDWLHLEARYNYEDQNTASAWVGYNFAGGEQIAWTITPMLGGVFGDTTGIAPGYKGSLTWRNLELYSEGEYLFDTGDISNSFFYTWSELTYSPAEWFRFGLVSERTKAYQSDHDVQLGFLVGFTWKNLDLAGYVFNPEDGDPIFVIGVRGDF